METLTPDLLQPAIPHALPFRIIFEEFRLRREDDLLRCTRAVRDKVDPKKWSDAAIAEDIAALLNTQEMAYKALAEASQPDVVITKPSSLLRAMLQDCADADMPLKAILHAMQSSALCLSGGGIRSASFGLGVLEGIANFSRADNGTAGLLDKLDYLSTVSGGGYIGSWLSAWLYRRKNNGDAVLAQASFAPKVAAPADTWGPAWQDTVTALAGKPPCEPGGQSEPVTGGDPEPQPVRHLRTYTSFLAPALGLTLDTSTLIAIIGRNLFINWVMLLPVLLAAIAAVRFSGLLLQCLHQWQLSSPQPRPDLLHIAPFFFIIAAMCAAIALPSHREQKSPQGSTTPSSGNSDRTRKHLLTVFFVAVLLGAWLLAASGEPAEGWSLAIALRDLLHPSRYPPFFLRTGIAFLGFAIVAWSVGIAHRARMEQLRVMAQSEATTNSQAAPASYLKDLQSRGGWRLFAWMLASAVGASFAASAVLLPIQRNLFSIFGHHQIYSVFDKGQQIDALHITFALPLVLAVLLMSTSLFCALIGVYEKEEDREWWVRSGGFFLIFALFWVLAHAAAFYATPAAAKMSGVAGLLLASLTSWVGFSGATAATTEGLKLSTVSKVGKFLFRHNLVLPVFAFLSIALIVIGGVWLEETVRVHVMEHLWRPQGWEPIPQPWATLVFCALCVLVMLAVNFAININLFSLGGMYRMRLMRAFLGASNGKRHPDPFTNFDPNDTPMMRQLAHGPGAPLHVINSTLNLVGTKNAAWAQRRAESFTFSAVHSGGWRVGYVQAGSYGGAAGMNLASAMAISGAAFNPNMGYQSSPILSLLMTIFCLRLGVWLPNPAAPGNGAESNGAAGREFFSKGGPSFALMPLLAEAFGLTNDVGHWVELTDGGHFENLALYEMVMRRCKHIIVVDAGADPKCQFEDLGNAIRKIRIDLGVPIRLQQDLKMRAGMERDNKYCVVGKIDYGCVDAPAEGQSRDELAGTLVYIKASLIGTEPADILQYAYTHPLFPHEGTGNQFYNESQFESYRHLGTQVIEQITEFAKPPRGLGQRTSIMAFTEAAAKFWARPAATTDGRRAEHTDPDAVSG